MKQLSRKFQTKLFSAGDLVEPDRPLDVGTFLDFDSVSGGVPDVGETYLLTGPGDSVTATYIQPEGTVLRLRATLNSVTNSEVGTPRPPPVENPLIPGDDPEGPYWTWGLWTAADEYEFRYTVTDTGQAVHTIKIPDDAPATMTGKVFFSAWSIA